MDFLLILAGIGALVILVPIIAAIATVASTAAVMSKEDDGEE